MSDEQTAEQKVDKAPERPAQSDQALPSMATWTPPWEGNINRPRPVDNSYRNPEGSSSES